MPDARYNVSVNFTVTRDGSGFSDMQKELGRIATSTEKTAKKSSLHWTELKSQIDLAAGALRTVAKVGQQVFEFGREGAQITQTTESFELMNEEIFKTPDLMERMRASSRGTISDVGLMQGVLKLTAGTSDELGSALAGAAPKLLEIAKASNKLNPALGDTAFLYDSISTGIKRASPLILDNLGIVVKVGEANKTYADQLGKTVAALTAEEKQMALLNATIAAGDTLISQVGGNVDSATDSYAQLEVGIANVTNELKILAAEGLGPVVGFLNEQVTQGGLFEELERVTDSQEKAIEVGNILFRTYEDHAHINAIVAKAVEIAGDNHELSAAQLVEYAEAALLADQNAENLVRGYQALVGETRDYTIAQSGVNALLRDVIPLSVDAEAALNEYNRTIASGAGTTNDYALAQISLKQRLEDLRPAIDDAKNAILGIREPLGLETGRAAFEIFVEANEAKAEIEDFQSELDGLEDFHKTELQVEDEAARAALEDYAAGAERLSIEANLDTNVDEALSDAEVINREYDKIEEERLTHFETNAEEVINIQVTPLQDAYGETPEEIITEFQTPGLDEALEETRRLQERLGQLPSQKDITINVRVNQTGEANAANITPDEFRATGGRFIVPPGFNEQTNPFIVAVESGEEVIVRTQSDRQRAAGIATGGGGSFVDRSSITIVNENQQAASVALAWVDRDREKRLNRWME